MLRTAVVALGLLARAADGGVISASSLEMCEKREDGSGNVDSTCEEKMVVSLTLQNMQEESDSIRSIPAATCSAAQDIGGVKACQPGSELKGAQCCTPGDDQSLTNPLIITASKSRVRLRYPVTYSHMTFNDDPYEIFLCGPGGTENNVDGGAKPSLCAELDETFGVGPFTSNACVDGSAEPEPSCGWRYPSSFSTAGTTWDGEGGTTARRDHRLKDSQGFCCECSLSDFVGTGEAKESRAGMLCDAMDLGAAHATAHCMRLRGLWYDAYAVEPAETHFDIDVRFRQCSDPGCVEYTDTILSVGPNNPEAKDPVSGSTVAFVGEFGPTQDNPSYESHYLLRPLCLDPEGDPSCAEKQSAEIEHTSRWLLLDRTRFTLSGLECNKVGVGYSAFRNQPVACEQPLGSCLDGVFSNSFLMTSSKIKDYYDDDMKRKEAGQTPLYFVGDQMASADFMMSEDLASRTSWGGGATYLEWEIDRFQQSLITVTLKGGMLSYERNIPSGRISGVGITTFESGQEGRVRINVENTGKTLEGQFSVGIGTCSNTELGPTACQAQEDCSLQAPCCSHNTPCFKSNAAGKPVTDTLAHCAEAGKCECNLINSVIDPFQAKPTRTLGPQETDEVTFAVRSSVALGASFCCNATLKSAYEVVDTAEFCFDTTSMERNFVGGDSCDPDKEDCEGMAGLGPTCAQVCPENIDPVCIFSNSDVCLGGIFWIVIWVVILALVFYLAYRLGLCAPFQRMFCGATSKK